MCGATYIGGSIVWAWGVAYLLVQRCTTGMRVFNCTGVTTGPARVILPVQQRKNGADRVVTSVASTLRIDIEPVMTVPSTSIAVMMAMVI